MAYSTNGALRFVSNPHLTSPISHAAHTLNIMNPTPYNQWVSTPGSKFCSLLNGQMCELLAQASTGFTVTPADRLDRADVFLSQVPADAGIYNFEHYGQLIQSKTYEFKRFDYGTDGNMKRYNQAKPPQYNLKNIGFPVAIIYGKDDDLADPTDVAWLHDQIKDHVIHYEELPIGHNTFIIGKNMTYFNETVVDILNETNHVAQL